MDAEILDFMRQYLEDASRGGVSSLEDYQGEWPAHAEAIKMAFGLLQSERPAFGGAAEGADFGHYGGLEEIGRGGQGVVYRATDTRLQRTVALKVLGRLGPGCEHLVKRFEREGEVAARLNHPGICGVLDAGVVHGTPYIAMQYVEGQTLAQRIQEARGAALDSDQETFVDLSVPEEVKHVEKPDTRSRSTVGKSAAMELVLIFEKTALALHAAHEAGIIHRDIKPANIMVTPDGNPVVLDFGLAQEDSEEMSVLTRTGELFGTPAYMSPEQLAAQRIILDPRTDIWSLGITFYECLTFERPFDAPTREGIYQAVMTKEPQDPRRLNPSMPSDLKVVLETCLEKDRDRRYRTAQDLAQELRRVREHKPIVARSPGPLLRLLRWTQRNPKLAAAVFGLFVVLIAGLVTVSILLESTRKMHAEHRVRVAPLVVLELTKQAREVLWPAVPDLIPAMEAWVADVENIATEIPTHERLLAGLRARGRKSEDGAILFEDVLNQLRYDDKVRILRDMKGLLADDRHGTTVVAMRERIRFARTVKQKTIDTVEAEWRNAIAEIRTTKIYRGLEIEPQLGLIPLGRDTKSGLFEFAHLQSGQSPERDPKTGGWKMTPDSCLIMVLLPGGRFQMGAQTDDAEDPAFDPWARKGEHVWVDLDPFFISKYEMTRSQWKRAMGKDRVDTGLYGDDSLEPAGNVRWFEAFDAARRLGLVLPTDARWEYACRAGTQTIFYTGNDWKSLAGHANIMDTDLPPLSSGEARPEKSFDGYLNAAPAHSFLPNPYGLHHMHGNVMEWCLESPHKTLRVPCRPGDGLREPAELDNWRKSARGGSFTNDHEMASSGFGANVGQHTFGRSIGLRPARDLDADRLRIKRD